MRYTRAVEKLRELAVACERAKRWPLDQPFLLEAYAFGEVLSGADPLDVVEVALVLNLLPEEVPWESSPPGTQWLADELRLSKGGFAYWWRSRLDPVPNHYIRDPVRFWSHDGPDEDVLQALVERRFGDLPRISLPTAVRRRQVAADVAAALTHLRTVCDSYWDQNWRREHRGSGRYPEHVLWEATHAYLDLRDAGDQADG
ncbi:MAG TPA: hypothetical protein VGS19_08345 [Streptosporangiaceae bacterium]|nr:hypothetical protein [Streptosporangiaceae bacterium]